MMKQYRGTHCGKESMLLMSKNSACYRNASSTFLSTLTVALITGSLLMPAFKIIIQYALEKCGNLGYV